MSDVDPKPGVVIDVEPEPAAAPDDPVAVQSPSDEPPQGPRPTGKAGRIALALSLLSVLGLTGLTAVGFWQVQTLQAEITAIDAALAKNQHDREVLQQAVVGATDALNRQRGALDRQQAVLAEQQQSVSAAKQAFSEQEQRLAAENLRLQERESELRAAVADVHRRVGRSGTQWIVAETDYLLRVAMHRLLIARDTETARVALELADQRLRDTQDPGWAGVREQLARDIAALGAFSGPDIAGIAARLSAAIEQVPQLTIARTTIGPERTLPKSEPRDPEDRSWDTLLEDLWAGLKGAVRIRERDQPVAAMLAPEHQFFLYENLKLRLETARLGLSRGDLALYHDNLDTAAQWLTDYFAEDALSVSLEATIAELRAIDIHPELPDISQSLRALELRRRLNADVMPPETAALPAPVPATTAAP